MNYSSSESIEEPPLSILVVDDEYPIRFAFGRYFTAVGFRVDQAAGREEAEALLVANQYSILIVDLRLSDTNEQEGLELISSVRMHSLHTRIITLTAFGSVKIEREAYKRGADLFLSKPQSLPELHSIISSILQSDKS
jgi:ActR/RegA family two-component response regulator